MIFGLPNIAEDIFAGPEPGKFWAYWNTICKSIGKWNQVDSSDDSWTSAEMNTSDWQVIPADMPDTKEC